MTSDELARLLAREGIDSSGLARFCLSPDGEQFIMPVLQTTAGKVWQQLRALVDDTGYWPVLTLGLAAMGWTDEAIRAEAALLSARETQTVIAEALGIDVPAWMDEQQSDYLSDEDDPDSAENKEGLEALAGIWPLKAEPQSDFWILTNPLPSPWLELRLVPTTIPWHVPAFFSYGNGPTPSEHVAVMREWHQQYGAEVVTITGDTDEFAVSRPPRTRKAAWKLAYDHFAYCPDVVIQGTQTVGELAGLLLRGTSWYFWWD